MQRGDFEGILEAMDGLGVTIRLLDPPLHEFTPNEPASQQEMATKLDISVEEVKQKVDALHEFNPMLGHRGCRLGITYPEITEMQARAIIEAACNLKMKGLNPKPEIMVPLVGEVKELKMQVDIIRKTAELVFSEKGVRVEFMVGTMIEIPRAAITADEIAEVAEFFSFGTNDLTQMTFGYSRDDVGKFLPTYLKKGILKADPFAVLDQVGVGRMVKMGAQLGRKTNPKYQVRYLWRTRWRTFIRYLLRRRWYELRILLPLPRPHRQSSCCSSRYHAYGKIILFYNEKNRSFVGTVFLLNIRLN